MAERHVRYSVVAAVLSGPLVASFAVYAAAQFVLDQIGASTILVVSLVVSLVVTLFVGPLVHGILRKRNWVRWFHYVVASALIATGVSILIAVLVDDLSSLGSLLPWLVGLGILTAVVSWGILRPDRDGAERQGRLWLAVVAASIAASAGVIALNLDHLAFASAVLTAERRPALLADAQWNEPASARRFSMRFHSGTGERELLAWLESNKFTVEPGAGHATRLIRSLPCNEFLDVTWRASGHVISSAEARVSEAGCL